MTYYYKAFILLPLLLLGIACNESKKTSAEDVLPIIDTHVHIYPVSEELNTQYIDTLVEVARDNGVSKILLGLNARHEPDRPPTFSSLHDEWVLAAADRYPDIIVPTLNGFDPTDPAAVVYVREALATGQWKMIGELDIRNRTKKNTIAADSAVLMEIYALAADYRVPVMLHFDFDYGTDRTSGFAELEHALDANPDTTFIYAHNCGPDIVSLMKTYNNLYCEQEAGLITPNLDMTRVVLGTDMQVHENRPELAGEQYAELITAVRAAIAGWSSLDQERASITTPTILFGL